MKKYSILFLAVLATTLTSCSEDFLDRTPLSEVTDENFFQKESDLILFSNSFYRMFPSTSIYNGDSSSDNIIQNTLSEEMRGARTVPTTGGGWSWTDLRNINYFLANYERVPDKNVTKHYGGLAKFFRAYFYFEKVKRFGDVPWYDYVIDPNDTASLEKPRDPRSVVVDNIMKDLDFAIENMKPTKNAYRISKWTALALKARVGLFEGTYMKYRGLKGYEKYLTQAVEAADLLMKESGYKVYSTGKPEKDYLNLFASHSAVEQEVILAREYSTELNIKHNVNYYTITSSYGRPGMPKDLVNSYLMKDGSRFTDKPNYNKIQFAQETKDRDLRLSQTIRTPKYTRIGGNIELAPDLSASVTGYQLIKYVTEAQYDTNSASIVDLPLFRYAEVLLNYAEAKAELGTLTQEDLDKSINVIRARVAMPALVLSAANATPDQYLANQYRNVQNTNKGVILEIRRERRIELYMEDHRWEDIVRWKEGQKLTQPIEGMYFPNTGSYDLDQNGTVDIHIYDGQKPNENQKGVYYVKLGRDLNLSTNSLVEPHPTFRTRVFKEEKDYLYPIPIQELQLNPNLKQNPGW
ncbi:RagB/SusD family nutrient uptake outer membrane protein [Myroides marinus]|uniref:RagB/SusD family nutrient uptake outer membrane protein n=1 Tax=Myroides marinus TaxID=703342 RepID=UPI0025773525|nr:RagB/SusD family nutrient uptake outer membrane protein [Myroides marinus]MDM1349935.1 RagB/SusD family nutrient uptake outer membrane protein [Myroides marinus]MDM1354643.1 RagB/SusD family nutrient uptake outer membrane protein [Myroides marinus]MDM1357142.1 RagB/SusD family nutrient uptake outer membrane protein [Myroides marinus]MDM1366124.1 RagB/SusD family nutrient uptake outer membrane protein [Myroides marinus]MDM1368343.1 RagB/SusD family nutrient uptake outer membrane protein [Myr